jgi:hypothetical protein
VHQSPWSIGMTSHEPNAVKNSHGAPRFMQALLPTNENHPYDHIVRT